MSNAVSSGVVSVNPARAHVGRIERLRVRHLRLLEQIAAMGSLSAAAQQMRISQPGATKMLQELEAAFGSSLIDRTPRGGQLSPAGAVVLDRLRIALGALDTAAAGLSMTPEIPLLRVGILPLIAVGALPAAVVRLDEQGAMPRLSIRESTVEGLMQLLLDGELDCAITPLQDSVNGLSEGQLRATRLWETHLAIAAAPQHPLTQRRQLTAHQLRDERWVLPPRDTSTRTQFEKWFLAAGVAPPTPHIESASFHSNLSLAATGVALTVAPLNAIEHYESIGLVRALSIQSEISRAHMFFITRPELAGLPSIEQFLNALRQVRPLDA